MKFLLFAETKAMDMFIPDASTKPSVSFPNRNPKLRPTAMLCEINLISFL